MDTITVAVLIITGLTEVIKRATKLNTRFIPLIAVVLGVLYAGFVGGWESTVLINGVIAGLTSVGLYRTVQKTIE